MKINEKSNEISKNYQVIKENIESFFTYTAGSFIAGATIKYSGGTISPEPLAFATLSTPIIDVLEYFTFKKKDLDKTIRNDLGTLAGQTLGWTLASLL